MLFREQTLCQAIAIVHDKSQWDCKGGNGDIKGI